MKIKLILSLCVIFFIMIVGVLDTSAESLETMPDSYTDLEGYLPGDVAEFLPEGIFSPNTEEALRAAETLTRPEYLFRVVLEAVGLRIDEALGLFCTLLALLLLSALLHRLRETVTGVGGEGVSFCLRLSMYALIITQAATMIEWIKAYFAQLSILMTGLIPLMGTLYALGGNVTGAAANEGVLVLSLQICEYATASVTPAVCGVCLAFALLDGFGSGMQVKFSTLGGQIKKWYTWFLGFVMFLLGVALSTQSILAAGADSLGMKGIKYAVGQMLPVVGGAVSGTLGTVAAGVELIRGVSGVCGLILIGLLLLPTLVQLLLFRMCYQTASTAASMLGCDGEAGLLGELSSLYGYMAAASGICSVVFVLALAIFSRSGAAIGG